MADEKTGPFNFIRNSFVAVVKRFEYVSKILFKGESF